MIQSCEYMRKSNVNRVYDMKHITSRVTQFLQSLYTNDKGIRYILCVLTRYTQWYLLQSGYASGYCYQTGGMATYEYGNTMCVCHYPLYKPQQGVVTTVLSRSPCFPLNNDIHVGGWSMCRELILPAESECASSTFTYFTGVKGVFCR